jgi:uncharacterized membrane protein YfcA
METLAYAASAIIGILLGLIGGGGSILTIPVLVYLFGLSPIVSTSYSLFVVGTTSTVGAFNNYKKGLVNIKTALLFGLPSVITVFAIRKYLLPLVPKNLFIIGDITITANTVTMLLFGILMIIAALTMVKNQAEKLNPQLLQQNHLVLKLTLLGIGIGIVTGLLGAGGGFLLIPALVFLVGLPMRQAVGTSLLIIAINSIVGFVGDIGHFVINWAVLLSITTIAIVGIYIGDWLGKKINENSLKKTFGWFVLVMGIYIIIKELLTNL